MSAPICFVKYILTEIFDHIYAFKVGDPGRGFDYAITWDIGGTEKRLEWQRNALSVSVAGEAYKTLQKASLPPNIIIYYSGQNDTVSDLIRRYRDSYRRTVRKGTSPTFLASLALGRITRQCCSLLC